MAARVLLVTVLLVAATPAAAAPHPGLHTGRPAPASAYAIRPVPGPVVRPFAPPASPYGAGHRGVDLAASPGEPVRAALAGVVAFSGEIAGAGWVTLRHGGGLETTYGDLDPRTVTTGEAVAAGAVIGRVEAAADHLDWGAKLRGRYIDPLSLLRPWRVALVA